MLIRVICAVLGFIVGFCPAAGVAFGYWRIIRRKELEDAEQSARALAGFVLVDGITLPLPTDARWKFENIPVLVSRPPIPYGLPGWVLETGKPVTEKVDTNILVLGLVRVSDSHHLFVGPQAHAIKSSRIECYSKQVWTAYRSRVARESVEAP